MEQTVIPDTGEILRVHPIAELFPMMDDEELTELAEDIKQNGLLQPIVRDEDGCLIDGRNRLAACRLAGVEPQFTTLSDGFNASVYILAQNVMRRHMSKGARAMVIAKVGGEYRNDTDLSVSKQRVSHARVVLEYAPEFAGGVIAGMKSLDEAYDEARRRKVAADSAEGQMAKLRTEAPDLADLVIEERMTLLEALGALRERVAQRRKEQETTTRLLSEAVSLLDPRAVQPEELAQRMAGDLAPNLLPDRPDLSAVRIRRCIAVLSALADHLEA